ncbi:MAG: PaaI family thioesterase [Candidatus Eremiobacteraeota bacterium]|nr:PaaI family thioesterase [Candidatus Eremiobacteraeota bacterium]MBV8364990.1 PaaI family thioesterase [Candidatus Eremiobacteraeota bacterium]
MSARGIDPEKIPEQFRRLLTDNPIVDSTEMEVVSYGDGRSVLRFPYKKEFSQYQGTVQGGIQAAYADAAMAVAVTSLVPAGADVVTTDLHIRFLRTITAGPIVARALITHRGKTLMVGEATVERADGTVCARVTATNMIVRPRGV